MDKIKDWFLEDPKRIQVFADAQEAFKQAIGHIKAAIYKSAYK